MFNSYVIYIDKKSICISISVYFISLQTINSKTVSLNNNINIDCVIICECKIHAGFK